MFLQYFAVTFKLKNVEVMKRHIVTNARPSDTFHHEAHFQKPFRKTRTDMDEHPEIMVTWIYDAQNISKYWFWLLELGCNTVTLRNQGWWKSLLHGEVKRHGNARTIGLFEVFDWIDPWHLGTIKLCTSGNSTQFPRGSRRMAVCESHVAAASVLHTPQSNGTLLILLIRVILTAASWSFWSKTTVTPRYSHQIRSCHHACGARAASGAQFCWRGSAYWVNVGEERSYWVNVGLIIVKFMVIFFF